MGRGRELARLEHTLADAASGRPALVLCGGEAGIGKSRLLDELGRRAGDGGFDVRWARAHDDIGSPPFWLWRQLLPERPPVDDPGAAPDRLTLFDGVVAHVAGAAATRPLLLVVEDAHWADEPSLLLLRYLVRQPRLGSVLVAATYRPTGLDPTSPWPRVLADLVAEPVTESIDLQGLAPDETARLFALIAESPTAEGPTAGGGTAERGVRSELGAEVQRVTAGNPFFVRELARAYRDTGRLGTPASVVEVVRSRLGRLAEPTARLLGAAAVLGEGFDPATVAAVLGDPLVALYPALDDGRRAGLLVGPEGGGAWRFSHALVRDAVEAQLATGERAALHRRAADALSVGADDSRAAVVDGGRAADVARHLLEAGPAGDPEAATTWALRAARQAQAALAYEESAAWFRRALDPGTGLDAETRCGISAEEASAWQRSNKLDACAAAVERALDLASRTGRPDLGARAVLEAEPVGSRRWDLRLIRWCNEALARLDGEPGPLAARLQARRAEAELYSGQEEAAERSSREALRQAYAAADAEAVVAGLRARQLALSGPEHGPERAGLADQMMAAGQLLRRPDVERWGRCWRLDTRWEAGDLAAVGVELSELADCVDRVGGPLPRWHLTASRAALAAAHGRYDEGLALARQAFEGVRAADNPAAIGSYLSFLCAVVRHVGAAAVDGAAAPGLQGEMPRDQGEVREAIFGHLGAAVMLVAHGQPDAARAAFAGAGPPETWRPPPYFRVLAWVTGAQLAVALGLTGTAEALRLRLEAERGRFAVAGAGTASYGGPVELALGSVSAFLGRLDEAVTDLDTAYTYCGQARAAGFGVEAACELAAVLARRDGPGDRDRAAGLAGQARNEAERLGMAPWVTRADQLAVSARPGASAVVPTEEVSPLSRREQEVAALVGQGLTNRQIADALFLSERTAQTHVQHILTKLGFSRRSQIAAWVAGRPPAGDAPTDTWIDPPFGGCARRPWCRKVLLIEPAPREGGATRTGGVRTDALRHRHPDPRWQPGPVPGRRGRDRQRAGPRAPGLRRR